MNRQPTPDETLATALGDPLLGREALYCPEHRDTSPAESPDVTVAAEGILSQLQRQVNERDARIRALITERDEAQRKHLDLTDAVRVREVHAANIVDRLGALLVKHAGGAAPQHVDDTVRLLEEFFDAIAADISALIKRYRLPDEDTLRRKLVRIGWALRDGAEAQRKLAARRRKARGKTAKRPTSKRTARSKR